jgi:hypothetical protein
MSRPMDNQHPRRDSRPKITWSRYVPEAFVLDYFVLGWSFADGNPVLYDDGAGTRIFILIWRCECELREPFRD